ncbi:MAG: ABC transporter permease subunit [Oscillospiraceae bacterium]|nr:ABC transporter permease subunit [Oscillospiraceae bacterium]
MLRKILHKPQAILGLAMMLAVILAMALAPQFAPNDPNKVDILHKFTEPCEQYPMGTDDLGRCIESRLIYGARMSMSIALPTIIIIAVISTLLATVCAYTGGIVDKVFVIVSSIFMALPPFLVAITLVGLFESKAFSIMISIVVAMWVWNAQVVRTYVLREKTKPYIITCRMSGCSELRIILRHVLPNIFPHLLVLYSTGLSGIIIMISSYAFLGLGLETGTAEWGAMMVNANKLIFTHPELIAYPGLCILFAAAGFNLFGEALRDICDPREG